jgi:hypothetical protein
VAAQWLKSSCPALALLLLLPLGQMAAKPHASGKPRSGKVGHKKKAAKPKRPIPVYQLQQGETIRFSAPAAAPPGILCGGNGDVFLVYGANPPAIPGLPYGPLLSPLVKLSPSSQTATG